MIRRNIYKWHRKLSIVALVPVLLWTLSGVMHPLMSNFKPELAKKFLIPKPLNTAQVQLDLDSVLTQNNIESFQNFRFVNYDNQLYYQLRIEGNHELMYFHAQTGAFLPNGDQLYAKQLAYTFAGENAGEVKDISVVTSFDHEYVEISRLLPAYRIAFNRADGLIVFVDTSSDRLGSATNDLRITFQKIFKWAHSWEFLNVSVPLRISVMIFFAITALLASISGVLVYGVMWENIKKSRGTATRKWHRNLGLLMSFALLMFACSAIAHMLPKYNEFDRSKFNNHQTYQSENIDFSVLEALSDSTIAVTNLSLAEFNGETYLQRFEKKGRKVEKRYFNINTKKELENGDQAYAVFLANTYGNHTTKEVVSVNPIFKFEHEYGFINKLLPVQKVQYKGTGNERLYVETATGRLGAKIEDSAAFSGFLFAYFHKYHFLDFMGKVTRDSIMSFFALGNFLVAFLGLIMLLKKPKAKKRAIKEKKNVVYN
ncbi:PepSY domain-containing protein [Sediminitomix flava]|uniref:PepSY-associated transmembrane protein n=1 Tax=Sediminitomix flava TaxID=379075 RepID=A0A315Z108_SEDFL|nr:PepSY domain-containing protein [Sediminitomix flava]PWJ35995.1 PepSY-associated transmembrane protein [Sediminitomix flava]